MDRLPTGHADARLARQRERTSRGATAWSSTDVALQRPIRTPSIIALADPVDRAETGRRRRHQSLSEKAQFTRALTWHGGERGIRTLDRVSPIHAFQACAFNHSAISPIQYEGFSIRIPRERRLVSTPAGMRQRHISQRYCLTIVPSRLRTSPQPPFSFRPSASRDVRSVYGNFAASFSSTSMPQPGDSFTHR